MTKQILYVSFSCIFFTSCITMKPVEFRRTENFSVTGNNNAPLINFGIVFHNPNTFGCTISDIESEGSFNNQVAFNAGIKTKVRAKANSDFTFPVTARIAKLDFNQLLGAGLNLLLNNEAIPMKVKGKIKMKKWLFSRTYDFNYTQSIDKAELKKLF
ncbi:MAG: LEA type 2 family protein [Bacteroidota bacterium]